MVPCFSTNSFIDRINERSASDGCRGATKSGAVWRDGAVGFMPREWARFAVCFIGISFVGAVIINRSQQKTILFNLVISILRAVFQ
jgi:hypothetical protein